ncbi:MAG: DUF502 domain-containing protein [Bacteroidetes bacterium]|nr:DUF502 domain-containing protein [Bacteroidota bacterium]
MSAKKRRQEFRDHINTTLIGGFLVILPLAILFIVFNWIFNVVVSLIQPITRFLTFGGRIDLFLANLLAIAIIILLCFGLGLFVKTTMGNYIYREIDEKILGKIPFYKGIRDTVKQFSNREKAPFSKVVMVNVFNSGTLMTGFITDEHDNDMVTVFVPTGPNPTNGFIFHVNLDQITEIDITVEEAMKAIISVGAGSKNIADSYFKNKG